MAIQMQNRLREAEEKYLHLEASLSAPDVAADPQRFTAVMKEYKAMTPLIAAYRACMDAEKRIEEALLILEESSDGELRELASEELREAKSDSERLQQELTVLLLPRDPNDEKNVLVEIRAGAGDDVVDMTSQRFEYVGNGVTVYGGLGNDTIWANNGENKLFGDAGNDRIVGGSGNDIIAGGAGNDSMHGGGGADTFCFGSAWGIDTVEQLESGSVTLWFESGSANNWNAETLTYSDGVNSVTVSGIANESITLKFGDSASAIAGAFDNAASEKVFEDKDKALIA